MSENSLTVSQIIFLLIQNIKQSYETTTLQ